MERIGQYANHTMSEQSERQSNTSAVSPERQSAIATLIQQTRSLSSLPLSVGNELAFAVQTWTTALEDIPDHMLGPSWKRATKDHDWSKPFPAHALLPAYKALLLEDRDRRQSLGGRRQDDTTRCRWCDDTGYVPIATYCPTGQEWYYPVYGCECAATPINQRSTVPVHPLWSRDDYGRWVPPSADASPKCRCGFCRNKGSW